MTQRPASNSRAKPMSTTQAAALCHVGRTTMLRWVKAGLIPSHTTGGGRYRLLREDLLDFMHARGIPVLEEHGLKPRVAIIDDDRRHVDALMRIVSQHVANAEIKVAYDGFEGGMLVQAFRPHLILLDYEMPGINGGEVCRTIRAVPELKRATVVVISGRLDQQRRKELTASGADRLMDKPLDPDGIVALLHELLPGPVDANRGTGG
jgi:two-component system, OmpR family, response regulator RpaA